VVRPREAAQALATLDAAGADNEEIYLGRLGLDRAEYNCLRPAGVV
jgi:hypothetical protein